MNETNAFMKGTPKTSLILPVFENIVRRWLFLTESESAADSKAASAMIFHFPVTRAMKNKFVSFINYPVCGIVLW
jgi:hypothetical protein